MFPLPPVMSWFLDARVWLQVLQLGLCSPTLQFDWLIRKLLATTKVCVPLLHPYGHCAILVIILAHSSVNHCLLHCACYPLAIEGSSWGGGFQIRSSSGPSSLVSEVSGALSNRELPSTSRGQLRAKSVVFGNKSDSTNSSRVSFSCLVLGFLLDSLSLLEATQQSSRQEIEII